MIVPNKTANVELRPIVNNRQTNEKPQNTPADSTPIISKPGDPNRSCDDVGESSRNYKNARIDNKPEKRRFKTRLAVDIAKKLGAIKPDITAALVAETICSWQNTRRNTHKINGKPAAYQSAAGLQEDLPWMGVSTISDAILRLEKAFPKWIKVKCVGNTVRSFLLDERFIKRYMGKEQKDCLYFRADDASSVGVLKALLIGNLEYRLKFNGAPKDERGNSYNSISSATYLTKQPNEQGALPVFPYSRVKVAKAIAELKSDEVFQKHPTMPDVYRVNREMLPLAKARKTVGKSPAKTTIIDCNQTVYGCNQTGCPVTKPVTSVTKLVTLPSIDIEDIEIDREKLKVSVYSARASHSLNASSIQESQDQKDSMKDDNQVLDGSGCARPSVECEPSARANALAKYIHPTDCELKAYDAGCKSIEDFFPGTLDRVNREVEKYRAMLKAGTILSVVPPDEQSPFEIILDPVYAGWLELDVDISPITNKPIDYGDMEEQIDLAIYYLDEPLVMDASKKDVTAFRNLFHQYPALLDVTYLENVFDHLWILEVEPRKKDKNEYVHDHYFFARRIRTLEQFVRYFHQLFAEAYVGYADEPKFYNGKAQRNWDRLLDDNGGTIPEPYWFILAPYYKEDEANRAIGLEADDQLASVSNDDKDTTQLEDYRQKLQIWPEDHEDDALYISNANFWSELEMQDYDDNRLNTSALVCGVNQ